MNAGRDGGEKVEPTERNSTYWIGFGFLILGVLIGTLLALSAQSLAQVVIAGIFTLFGGSLLVMLEKLSSGNQAKAGIAILAISLGTLTGLYTGIYVNEHQFLTPAPLRASTKGAPDRTPQKYLRENVMREADAIDVQVRTRVITPAEAYDKLRSLLEQK